MPERPIIFSGPMVRAILEGRKSMTRRVVKYKPFYGEPNWDYAFVDGGVDCQYLHIPQDGGEYGDSTTQRAYCPYGVPGDALWVREAWTRVPQSAYWHDPSIPHCRDGEDWIIYRAGWERSDPGVGWHPSIHMPRWASRITLEVTGVRVERVHDISGDDAIAEGIIHHNGLGVGHSGYRYSQSSPVYQSPDIAFAELWDSINGKKHPWSSNPWVWVIEFRPLAQAKAERTGGAA